MAKDNTELFKLKRELMAALRAGDMEIASDTLLEIWAHHGVVNGNMSALDRFAVGSGLIQGMKERQRVAKMMASTMSKMIVADSDLDEPEEEVDYSERLKNG
jgi:uncharacterized tellurite resistance protein B-like protein